MLHRLRYISAKGVAAYLKYLTYFYNILASTPRGPLYYHRALTKASQALAKGTQEQLWAAKQDFQTVLSLAKRGGNEELEAEIERLIPEIERWIQEARESAAQQKPGGGMCGVISSLV